MMMMTPTMLMIACAGSALPDAIGRSTAPSASNPTAEGRDAPVTLELSPAAPETELPRLGFLRTGAGTEDPNGQPADPFAEGSRHWSLTFGTSRDPDLGRIYLSQFSIDHYFEDGLAFRAGLTIGYADAERTSGGLQGGPEFGLRWHFLRVDRFSFYLDGSVATVIHQNPLTPNSLRFNFDLKAGLGATFQLDGDTHLKAGLGWHHLSNARVRGRSRNLGYDAPIVYLGLMRSF